MQARALTRRDILASAPKYDERRLQDDAGFRRCGIAFLWSLVVMAPILGIGGRMMQETWRTSEDARLAAIEAAQAYERVIAAAPLPAVGVEQAAHGRDVFMSVCIACHGSNGKGVEGLGKNLVESDFVAGQSDDGLSQFLAIGRPMAKPMPMPPKGGREDLTDGDLRQVVAYLRGLQDPRRMPELPAMAPLAVAPPSEADKAAALAAAGGDAELAGYIASGTKLFSTTCIACHGPGGVGIKGNGKPLVHNEFVQGQDDDALLAFVKKGRDPGDPKNTTGVAMPPKGGNPALKDDDLLDIISYVRTLQGTKPAAGAGK